jgi:hypothetical protein
MKYLLIVCLFLIPASVVAEQQVNDDKVPLPLPKARDMKDLGKKAYENRIQERKVWFRNYIIEKIKERTELGYTYISEEYYPSDNKRVYEDFFKELEEAGYKLSLGKERWNLSWGD